MQNQIFEVLQVATNLGSHTGGPFQVVTNTSVRLARSFDYRLLIFGSNSQILDSVQVIEKRTFKSNRYGFFLSPLKWEVIRSIKNCRTLIFHGVFLFPLLVISLLRSSRIIVMPHGSLEPYDLSKNRFLKTGMLAYLRLNPFLKLEFWVASESEKKNVLMQFPNHKVTVVGLGIDLSQFRFNHKDFSYIAANSPRLIYLGRIAKKKNIEAILETLKLPDNSRLTLTIIGDGDKRIMSNLRTLTTNLGLGDKVHFKGAVNGAERFSVLHDADIFVLPSSNENFAIAVAESIAALTPVIISKDVAMSDFVRKHGCGMVLESLDPKSISSSIQSVTDSFGDFISNCLQARELLSWDEVIKKWIKETSNTN